MTLDVRRTNPLATATAKAAPPAAAPQAPAQPSAPQATDQLHVQAKPAAKPHESGIGGFFDHLLGGAEHGLDHGIDWVENHVTHAAESEAAHFKHVPILGSVLAADAWVTKQSTQLLGGVVKGAGTMVFGIGKMAVHPVDTLKGLYALGEHIPMLPVNPLRLAHGVYDVAVNHQSPGETLLKAVNPVDMLKDDASFGKALVKGVTAPYAQEVHDGKYAEAVGRGVFDIGSLVLTAGGGAALKGAEGTAIAADAARGVEVADAARGAQVADAARGAEAADAARGADEIEMAADSSRGAVLGGGTPYATDARALTTFREGTPVVVRRSSGMVDDGWRIEGRVPNGRIRVAKDGVGYKDLSEADLVRANPNLLELPAGTPVVVRRTSGALEDGWQVDGKLPNGNFQVSRGPMTKQVPPKALLEQNPELVGEPVARPLPVIDRGQALAESRQFQETGRVGAGTPIHDGYVDGGRSMRLGADGSVQSSREVITVDRARDANLRQYLDYARSLRSLPEAERAQKLQEFVDGVMSQGDREAAVANSERWATALRGQQVLLGDVGKLGGGVCRHRALLYKVLGDEAGLNVDLVRGKVQFMYNGGAHAWNEVTLANGKRVLVDVMNPQPGYRMPELSQAPAVYTDSQGHQFGQLAVMSGH